MTLSATDRTVAEPAAAGRRCPLHYRYRPEVFASPAPAELSGLDVLYVVGGLYGNPLALERVLALFDRENGRKRLVFNGDFHWFDADAAVFDRIQRGVLDHTALRGNVETELASDVDAAAADAGCGCAYPAWVGDEVVERSNRILRRLRRAASAEHRKELAALPMWLRAEVGGLRLGIVHGDAQSLAGWGFAQEHLRDATHLAEVRRWFDRAQVDAFACTHTCLPVFHGLRGASGSHGSHGSYGSHGSHGSYGRWIFNNGATGMPNFAGDPAGLLTRVALTPFAGAGRRFGVQAGEVHVDAVAVEIDGPVWRESFLRQWPEGSDAHASYFGRILHGPTYRAAEAIRVEA